ncbi:protein phosphatase 2C domain-containing protein [Massilia sp.]|uniref:protein phosphatase 2C domain-containing protein n=1 Tax=Massilia sp. TaxID=1882437 RepID=UPI0028AA709D|nr:protein phosphatase 2C domain-containing protein [Massilia sp.]
MTIERISCAPGDSNNEDLVAVFETDGLLDLLVVDGATSVADRDYADADNGDVAWFVQSFAAELGKTIDAARAQGDSLRLAIDAVRRAYAERTAGHEVPLYAQPLAALTWIRIRHRPEALDLSLYCLGDCKALAIDGAGVVTDLDPYENPFETVVQDAVTQLAAQGVLDPGQRFQRLLPLLRERREVQHAAPAPAALCLAPQGEFSAREIALRLAPDSAVLAMSDGFYRLVDPYGLMSWDELARRCRVEGLASLMRELRAFETARAGAAAPAVKNADDASAILWTPPSSRHDQRGPTAPTAEDQP